MSFGLLLVEVVCWWILDASKPQLELFVRRWTIENANGGRALTRVACVRVALGRRASDMKHACRPILRKGLERLISEKHATASIKLLQRAWRAFQGLSVAQRLDYFFFKPVESINSAWLVYITMAQTIGSYSNCSCMSSTFGGGGG
jgi:hypothetical protein